MATSLTACVLAAALVGGPLLTVGLDAGLHAPGQVDAPRQVARLTVQGLAPVTPPFLPAGPRIAVYTDGTVLALDTALPTVAPQVWPYRAGRVEPRQVEALMDRARTLGLLTRPTSYAPSGPPRMVQSHPPRTILVLATPGETFTHVVDGLDPSDTAPPRVAVRQFVGALQALGNAGDAAFYTPTRLHIVAAPVEASSTRVTVDWPAGGVDLAAATRCTSIGDRATIAFLTRQASGMHYRHRGRVYRIAARVVLPGGDDC